MTYDCVVVGAGLSGLCAALRLTEGGMRVAVVASGTGSLHLGGATIDILGYAPEVVTNPRAALQRLASEQPEHPYARLGVELVTDATRWFTGVVPDVVGGLDENMLLPTAVGAAKPSALAPTAIAAGDLRRGGSLVVCGFRALKDLYPAFLAENLAKGAFGAEVEARGVLLEAAPGGRADVNGVGFARAFEDPAFRSEVIDELRGHLVGADRVGFPALLGGERAAVVRRALSEGLGAEVFEIPTLPPSVPGIRLFKNLKRALVGRGCRIRMGATAVGGDTDGRVVRSIHLDVVNRVDSIAARHVVLATGGIATGGIEMDSYNRLHERVLDLPVAHVPPPDRLFDPTYLARQPVARAGIAVDHEMRPVDAAGGALFDNVRVVGATVGGAEPWREKSGNGLALATGYAAAKAILESEGAWS